MDCVTVVAAAIPQQRPARTTLTALTQPLVIPTVSLSWNAETNHFTVFPQETAAPLIMQIVRRLRGIMQARETKAAWEHTLALISMEHCSAQMIQLDALRTTLGHAMSGQMHMWLAMGIIREPAHLECGEIRMIAKMPTAQERLRLIIIGQTARVRKERAAVQA